MTTDQMPLPPGVRAVVCDECGKVVSVPAGAVFVNSQACQCPLPRRMHEEVRSRVRLEMEQEPVAMTETER